MKRLGFWFSILLTLITLALALPAGTTVLAAPPDVTISSAVTFSSIDGGPDDADGLHDGTFTVTHDLHITATGRITQTAPAAIKIVVGGDMTMDAGSFITDTGSGSTYGGAITITIGNFAAVPPTGMFIMAPGATIDASGFQGGPIVINAAGSADVNGLVVSEGSGTGSGSGPTANPGHGGTIFIDGGCALTISDQGHVRSFGHDPGADLVHLRACKVTIEGLVESTGSGHAVPGSSVANHLDSNFRPDKPSNSTAGVEVWANTIVIDKTNGHNGEINADLCCAGGTGGTSWIDLLASGEITILGASSGNFAVHANENMGSGGTGSAGGIITIKSVGGTVTASGLALQANGVGDGGDGGEMFIQAFKNVILDDAQILAVGDYVPTIGNGGAVQVRSFSGLISWKDLPGGVVATGDVRPTGSDTPLPLAPAGNRGYISFQKCTPGAVDVTGTSFPVAPDVAPPGVTATSPTTSADICTGAPDVTVGYKNVAISYVSLPANCDACSCHAALTITKIVAGAPPLTDWSFTSDILGYASFTIPAIGGSVHIDPINPGTYHITELTKPGYVVTPGATQVIVVEPCHAPTVTFTNTSSTTCKWCTKSAVLSQVVQNLGFCCAVPDILVDVRLSSTTVDVTKLGTGEPATGSIQAAIDFVNSPAWLAYTPHVQGEIFIGVTGQDCGTGTVTTPVECAGQVGRAPNGNGTQNVVVTNTRPDRLDLFGCSITLTAKDPTQPVVTIQNSVGKVTVLDIHVTGSLVAGYVIQNNADLVVVKNSRATNTNVGYDVQAGDKVEITGSPDISGDSIGILVNGGSTTLRDNNHIVNNGIGVEINGNNNDAENNDVGAKSNPNGTGFLVTGQGNTIHSGGVEYNTGDGIIVSGSGNTVNEVDINDNGGNGILVSGNTNTIVKNKQTKTNAGDGIKVTGNSNTLDSNVCEKNGAIGFEITGSLNKLIKNEASNNTGVEFKIAANNNVGSSGNKANGSSFSFGAAGGSFGV